MTTDARYALIKNYVTINKNDNQILQGIRNQNDGLWDIKLSPNNINGTEDMPDFSHKANFIITKDKSQTKLAQYLHGTVFSPAIITMEYAIRNGNFIS